MNLTEVYFSPFYIKKYKTNAAAECFIREIRASTVYQYNADGFIKDYNPNNRLFRNEKDKGLYLKEQRDLKTRYGGGTTAIFVNDTNKGQTIITSIAFFGWQQSLILAIILLCLLYAVLFSQKDAFAAVGAFIVFNSLFSFTSSKALRRQKELIEIAIDNCEKE